MKFHCRTASRFPNIDQIVLVTISELFLLKLDLAPKSVFVARDPGLVFSPSKDQYFDVRFS